MKIYYSPSKGGFYNSDFFTGLTMPDDVVEITAEDHAALFEGQAAGKLIVAGKDGKPINVDRPPPSKEDIDANMRVVRNRELADTDGVVNRHRDEKDLGVATTITDKDFKDVLGYRQSLRDLPETIAEASTFEVALPAKPTALQ